MIQQETVLLFFLECGCR